MSAVTINTDGPLNENEEMFLSAAKSANKYPKIMHANGSVLLDLADVDDMLGVELADSLLKAFEFRKKKRNHWFSNITPIMEEVSEAVGFYKLKWESICNLKNVDNRIYDALLLVRDVIDKAYYNPLDSEDGITTPDQRRDSEAIRSILDKNIPTFNFVTGYVDVRRIESVWTSLEAMLSNLQTMMGKCVEVSTSSVKTLIYLYAKYINNIVPPNDQDIFTRIEKFVDVLPFARKERIPVDVEQVIEADNIKNYVSALDYTATDYYEKTNLHKLLCEYEVWIEPVVNYVKGLCGGDSDDIFYCIQDYIVLVDAVRTNAEVLFFPESKVTVPLSRAAFFSFYDKMMTNRRLIDSNKLKASDRWIQDFDCLYHKIRIHNQAAQMLWDVVVQAYLDINRRTFIPPLGESSASEKLDQLQRGVDYVTEKLFLSNRVIYTLSEGAESVVSGNDDTTNDKKSNLKGVKF